MRAVAALVVVVALGAIGWGVYQRLEVLDAPSAAVSAERAPAPVEVAPVEHGEILLRRTFSGALEASAEFVAAPKVGGRIVSLEVDLGDPVKRGQIVARLDDEELVQAVHQADADLQVAEASLAEAESALEIAKRELKRADTLRTEGVNSESQLDAARSIELARRARVEVARAGVTRAKSAVESARIRAKYAHVTADWKEGDDHRVVGVRYVDEGNTISANSALLSIVEIDPVTAVVFVPERDYALLAFDQPATLRTDAFPGVAFAGKVERIAPVFRRATRQARVEIRAENADERLKPGMFVRATIDLERIPEATVVPYDALTERGDRTGVFQLDPSHRTVRFVPVVAGVRDGSRIAVVAEGLTGYVVTLGQELCDDDAPVVVTSGLTSGSTPAETGPADAAVGETPEAVRAETTGTAAPAPVAGSPPAEGASVR